MEDGGAPAGREVGFVEQGEVEEVADARGADGAVFDFDDGLLMVAGVNFVAADCAGDGGLLSFGLRLRASFTRGLLREHDVSCRLEQRPNHWQTHVAAETDVCSLE